MPLGKKSDEDTEDFYREIYDLIFTDDIYIKKKL